MTIRTNNIGAHCAFFLIVSTPDEIRGKGGVMNWPLAGAFWVISMLLVLTPGPDWAYVISAGLSSRRGVLAAVVGVLTGHVLATVAVAAGIATVVAASTVTMTLLTFAGSGYMIWLGVQSLRNMSTTPFTSQPGNLSGRTLFAKGLTMNLLNPKLYVFFLALLPQFISETAVWPVGAQILTLGVIHTATCAGVYFVVGYGANKILMSRPRAAKVVGVISGVVMVALGVVLITEEAWSLLHFG